MVYSWVSEDGHLCQPGPAFGFVDKVVALGTELGEWCKVHPFWFLHWWTGNPWTVRLYVMANAQRCTFGGFQQLAA